MQIGLKHSALSLCLAGLLAMACKPMGNGPRTNPAPTTSPSSTTASDSEAQEKEKVDIPTDVTGALLTCALRKEASESDLETEIGCRLSDPVTGKKLSPNALLSFSSNDPLKVTSEAQADASIYHVIYRIKGTTHDEIRQIAQSAEAIVLYNKTNIKQEKIYNVLKPAIELDDYEAPIVREQAIDRDDPGSL